MDHVIELHDVGVAELAQSGNFAQSGAGDSLILGLQADLLHGHEQVGLAVPGLVYHSVRALSAVPVLLNLYVAIHGWRVLTKL